MSFVKKNFIYTEKSGTVTKAQLRKFKKHRTVIVEITHKIRTSFKTLVSKTATTRRLKKSQSNDKLL